MGSVNKVILIGHLGKDPDIKIIDNGTKIAKMSIATAERFKDKNGNLGEHTEWHNLIMWRNLAESADKVLKKGSQVYVEGKIRNRNWLDKEGNKRFTTEIEVDEFVILSKRSQLKDDSLDSSTSALPSDFDIDNEFPE
ncbi:MAG: hypothetical protein A2X12_06480 [Bacteroidetes bacterium GWE2_29_8]|nr:MAG: hypothetical protein A2X12_06480 [Bacteroidetes bacterium GWE2_29_8]